MLRSQSGAICSPPEHSSNCTMLAPARTMRATGALVRASRAALASRLAAASAGSSQGVGVMPAAGCGLLGHEQRLLATAASPAASPAVMEMTTDHIAIITLNDPDEKVRSCHATLLLRSGIRKAPLCRSKHWQPSVTLKACDSDALALKHWHCQGQTAEQTVAIATILKEGSSLVCFLARGVRR